MVTTPSYFLADAIFRQLGAQLITIPVSDADVRAVRNAGYTDANVIDIVALVAMYSLTNFFNYVFDPEKDFPAVMPAGSI